MSLYDINIAKKKCNTFTYEICIFVSFCFPTILVVLVSGYHFRSITLSMQMSASTELSLESTRKRAFDRYTSRDLRADLRVRSGTQTAKWYVLKGPNRFTACGPIGSRVTYACPWGDLPQVSR